MVGSRQPIGLKRTASEPPVSDPRRAYDRGVWTETGEGGEGAAVELARPPAPALAGIATELLRRELDRRQRGLVALIAKRDAVRAEIAGLDAAIAELSEEPRRPARGGGKRAARLALPRPKNAISLPDAIALEVEVGQSITPADAAKRVLASGYQTTARTFTMVVANALSKDKRFKRLGRGKYERVR